MSSWHEAHDEHGRVYYYNVLTQETSWEPPAEHSEKPGPSNPWKTFKTEDGREYFYNEQTGETTWDKPIELAEGDTKAESLVPEETTEQTKSENPTIIEEDRTLQEEKVASTDITQQTRVLDESQYRKDFMEMLETAKVDSTWSFEKVILMFIKDPLYWAVPDALQRKAYYDEYLLSKLEKEASNRSQVIEKFKHNFRLVLDTYKRESKLGRDSRWSSIKRLLVEEENLIFKHSVLPDSEVEKIFRDYITEIAEKEDEDKKKSKEEALLELERYLRQILNIGSTSDKKSLDSWDKIYQDLESDPRFKANKHFQILDKLDILRLYMDKLYPHILSDIKRNLQSQESKNYRTDRKARAAFKDLLHHKFTINANTLFKELLPKLEEEDAFIELCGRRGSTPLELFWDVVDEKNQLLKVKKDLITNIIRDLNLDQNEVFSTKESFTSTLASLEDEKLSIFDFHDTSALSEVNVIYESLLQERALQRQKQKKQFEDKLASKEYALADWLNRNISTQKVVLISEESSEGKCVLKKTGSSYRIERDEISLKDWEANLLTVDAYLDLRKIVFDFHNKSTEEAESTFLDSLRAVLSKLLHLLNENTKKRQAPEEHFEERKVPRKEQPRKPVFINY